MRLTLMAPALMLQPSALPPADQVQVKSGIHQVTYWQERRSCEIRSSSYNGPCMLTVISFGESMNIHFDIDKIGTQGLTFAGNLLLISADGASLAVMGVVERFRGPNRSALSPGICAVTFARPHDPSGDQPAPWNNTRQILCVSEDGRFSGTAE
jgi:hypothetical protein